MRKGTIQITVETQSALIIRGVNPVRARCTRCPAEVDTVVLEVSGALARVDQSAISTMAGNSGIARDPDERGTGL